MVVILGGGVGGLSAAYYLLKHGKKNVILSEASSCLGGWVKTKKLEKVDGIFVETGPRTVRPVGPQGSNTLSLIEDLNLSDKVKSIPRTHPAAKNRFIYAKNKLNALPSDLMSLFKTVPPFSKPLFFAIFKEIFAPVKHSKDESLYSFVERRFGKDLAEYAISPLVCGICAGDSKEISVKFLLPKFFEAEQKYGSIFRSFYKLKASQDDSIQKSALSDRAKNEGWSVWMLDGGLQVLPDTLGTWCKTNGAELKINSPCSQLKFIDNQVMCKIGNDEIATDHVISSLPAKILGNLLPGEHKDLSDELKSIKFVTVGVVHLVYKGQVLKQNGFGFLVPPCEQLPILGVIFDSCCNPQKDYTILTVMMGGKWFDEYFGEGAKPEQFLETARSHVKNILGISVEPEAQNVDILKDCIPQYVVGHNEKIERIFAYLKDHDIPLSLVGSSYHGVGLNDVILSSRKAVELLVKNEGIKTRT